MPTSSNLDDAASPPILTLVHVKGAKSGEADRGISVSAYEVVVGQAIKNLRFLDRLHLTGGLRAGLEAKIGRLVWHDGAAGDRDGMIAALGRIGASYRRRVIVLQPQVTESGLTAARAEAERIAERVREAEAANDPEAAEAARAAGHKGEVGRLHQLDTLLVAAEATAHGLGAELIVLGDGTPAPGAGRGSARPPQPRPRVRGRRRTPESD